MPNLAGGVTLEQLGQGIQRFIDEKGRMPSATDIDECSYMPTARQFQRRFGGVKAVRAALGYEVTDLGSGISRSESSTLVGARGQILEAEVEAILMLKFGEVFVHTQKKYGTGNSRLDCYVYTPKGNFGVDVFGASTSSSLHCNISKKLKTYGEFYESLYLLYSGAEPCRYIHLPDHVAVMSIDEFKEHITLKHKYIWNGLKYMFTS